MGASDAQRARGGSIPRDQAEFAVAHLAELSADLRGCALLGPRGGVLAASGDHRRWKEAALALLGAADAVAEGKADHVHVAVEEGEAFAVRHGGLAMVAVAERFALASLLVFDMRTILRDLTGGGAVLDRRAAPDPARRKGGAEAEAEEGEED